jgi:hypothetical protein
MLNQTKRRSDRLRSFSYVREHLSGVAREKCAGGILREPDESDHCEPKSASCASALTWQNRESQMTKMKTLSAAIILSAAVATPVFAQDADVRGPGSRYGLESQTGPGGAYNQLTRPSYATTRALDGEDKRDMESFGFSGRDPSRVGAENPDLKPSN